MGGFLVAFVGFLFCIFINGFAVTLWISRPKGTLFYTSSSWEMGKEAWH
jgi:hypothetical protein